ncbi:DUF4123 domain-containing protein [Paraburkholderia phenoliruptrix]|uniref:DUF4123 domain-containing protein n=2 Tax=Paraburkholderia phenoliruptrix TaxID=252970 RepID=K0DE21_9BURK|nr:DUF4123 domain-containing protein [Paraburkholderia phenoliruptrix]AFT84161.1 hypothetical protein BUPH_03922 [Paraburkholderia phenoliruptrix BR3459a]MDR6387706.1 hypothetical protein [Paraburkholderia phenoliruptrix]CAB4050906.1 hypothetical protein LMG9964_04573 [Paraburkholderia phenoliruptrix]
MDQYLIVEPDNGSVDLGTAPRMYEIGEIVPAAMPELKGVMPMLYSVEHPEQQLPAIEVIAGRDQESGLPPRVCALLETDASAETLMKHISDMIALPRETGGHSVFRFYDPRVVRNLGWVLQPEQLSLMLGPVQRWRYYSDNGWLAMEHPAVAPAERLSLSTDQWATLRRLHLIEQALKSIRDVGEPVDDRTPRRLDALFTKGTRYRLAGEDLTVFAVQGLLVSSNFDRHPKVAAALQPGQTSSYSEITAQWSDENWAVIAQEVALYAQQ